MTQVIKHTLPSVELSPSLTVEVPLLFCSPDEEDISTASEATETLRVAELQVGDWVKYPSQPQSEWLEVEKALISRGNYVFLQLRRLGGSGESYPWMGDWRWRFTRRWSPRSDPKTDEF